MPRSKEDISLFQLDEEIKEHPDEVIKKFRVRRLKLLLRLWHQTNQYVRDLIQEDAPEWEIHEHNQQLAYIRYVLSEVVKKIKPTHVATIQKALEREMVLWHALQIYYTHDGQQSH